MPESHSDTSFPNSIAILHHRVLPCFRVRNLATGLCINGLRGMCEHPALLSPHPTFLAALPSRHVDRRAGTSTTQTWKDPEPRLLPTSCETWPV